MLACAQSYFCSDPSQRSLIDDHRIDKRALVSDGRDRVDIPYTIPSNLRFPDLRLVYLDLNHWINLSKSKSGHKDGERYRPAFDACAAAVDEGSALFPVSLSTIMEINAIRDPQQRLWLRWTIEKLSRFRAVLPRAITAALEFEQALANKLDNIRLRTAPVDFVGVGIEWLVGVHINPSIVDRQNNDVTTELISSLPPEFRWFMDPEFMSYTLIGIVIEGPANPSEEADLKARGWNPQALTEMMDNRVLLESQFVRDLDEYIATDPSSVNWRKGRLRDIISARELYLETNEMFSAVLNQQELTIEDVFDTSETPSSIHHNRCITDSMPTFDVAVTLKTSYHRNRDHSWTRNDIFDIDAMSTVLPYCDMVVTDKAMASHVGRTKLAGRLDTTVMSSLDDLVEKLAEA